MNEIVKRGKKIVQAGADDDLADRLRVASERSLYVFAKGICGMGKFVPHLHRPMCDDFLMSNRYQHRAALWPRSTFKTSMARCLGIHMTIQEPDTNPYFPGRAGYNLRILYAGETERRALSRIGWIRRQYENNELLRALWPHLVPWKNPRVEASMWTASHFALQRTEDYTEGTFEAAGVDSGSTGSHYDVSIKDDLIGLRSRQQPELMPKAIEWFQISHSLTDEVGVSLDYVFGTRWAAYDLYSWMDEYEDAYHWDRKQIINDNFDEDSILFPERFTLKDILSLERKNGELFYLNYMNKATGAGTTAFDMRKCQFFKVVNGEIEYVEAPETSQILDVIEHGRSRPDGKPRVKKIWEMTPQERVELWTQMQKNWYARRITQMEVQ